MEEIIMFDCAVGAMLDDLARGSQSEVISQKPARIFLGCTVLASGGTRSQE